MYVDNISRFLDEEDREALNTAEMQLLNKETLKNARDNKQVLMECMTTIDRLTTLAETRYKEYLAAHPEQILPDIKTVVEALTEEEYQQFLVDSKKDVERLTDPPPNAEKYYTPGAYSYLRFIIRDIEPQLAAYKCAGLSDEPALLYIAELADNKFPGDILKLFAAFDVNINTEEVQSSNVTKNQTEPDALEREGAPRISAKPTNSLLYPLDKPNSKIWNIVSMADKSGQLQFSFNTAKKGSRGESFVLFSIDFDELGDDLTITRDLTQFDKRVYVATAALYNSGNDVVSATQIYKMMGNRGSPTSEQIKKINDSLTKMGAARIFIDNEKEAHSTKYSRFRYDASLLPFERMTAYINNTPTESAIRLFREPPLITFARERNQISNITRELLESPVSKTEANLLLDDYLIERIAHMKRGKGNAPRKILFSTIYERCNITTIKQKQRAPGRIKSYLDHYKNCGYISGYKEEKDGITISL